MIIVALLLLLQTASVQTSGLSGTVIASDTAFLQPQFHARVELRGGSAPSLVVRTGDDGKFDFSDVLPGRYELAVSNEGFVRSTMIVSLAPGQQRGNFVIALNAAPTLYGHIFDRNNVPMANIYLEAIRVVYGPRGDRSVETEESALSDDRGEYHLYWLAPGEYYIRASILNAKAAIAAVNISPEATGPSYAPTYYPGSRDPKDAASIRLRAESNPGAFDFKLQPANLVDLWGNISVEAVHEGIGTMITVTPAGAGASVQKYEGRSKDISNAGYRDAGEFSIAGMPPGTYVVSAEAAFQGQQLVVHRKLTLKGTERAFILQLSPGSPVRGSISAESGAAVNLQSSQIVLDSVDPDLPSPPTTSIGANGQFAAERVEPGDYAIRFVDLPGDLYVKSAQAGNTDILANPLHVDFVSPDPIRVVLGADGCRLDGIVLDNADHGFAHAQVVLVPDAGRRNSPSQYRIVSSDENGRFTLHGIPPGEYKLFAWQEIEPNAYLNPNYLAAYENMAMPLRIMGDSPITAVRLIPED